MAQATDPKATSSNDGLSRRRLLGLGVAAGTTAGIAGISGLAIGMSTSDPGSATPSAAGALLPFHGEHQAGISDPPGAHCVLAAYDVTHEALPRLSGLMDILTDDLIRIMSANPALADTAPRLAQVRSRLAVSVGVGPGLLARLGAAAPAGFAELPAFASIDQLDPAYCGGDLLLRITGDDPLTVAHAHRMLFKDTRAFATPRWVQRGFLDAAGFRPAGQTARNLMGQLDGTVNPAAGTADFDRSVWINDGSAWDGGTTLVVRRIRMQMDLWDELDPSAMGEIIGRHLDSGAPLTGTRESDTADLDAVDEFGLPVIRDQAHIRRAKAASPDQQMLRRPYNYDDSGPAGYDAGQLFMAFVANIATQFVPVQQRLAEGDMLNQWTIPVGSAVFAVLPGVRDGQKIGQGVIV